MAGHVVAIGGGFSGAMLAVNLARQGATRVTLIERGAEPGRGLAYGYAHPTHLLNVRAGSMSALHDAPDHFARWLERQGMSDAASAFAPRRLYGTYVQALLNEARAGGHVEIVQCQVEDAAVSCGTVRIGLQGGATLAADAAVLALGNAPPRPPRGVDPAALPAGTYVGDPWTPGVADRLGADDHVLIIGTGLTMVDIALLLQEEGFKGPILALSRRGLIPRAHAAGGAPAPRSEAPSPIASALVRSVRRRAEATGWRSAVDELRPVTQSLWREASPAVRARFLRHLRPWWDVHRHRIAPEIDARLQAMIGSGQLRVAAGKIAGFRAGDAGVALAWRPRGSDREEVVPVARIINCTGPEANLRSTADPLLHRLLKQGVIRPDPLGIGVDVDAQSRVISHDGESHSNLFAVGPITRGAFWEVVAVPDIRKQVWEVAQRTATM